MLRALNRVARRRRRERRRALRDPARRRARARSAPAATSRSSTDLRDDASEHKILFEDMVLRRLARLPMPTIAAIDGPALGGGLELALACDLRVCSSGVALGLTGVAARRAWRATARCGSTRLVGPARAKEMLFTGETIDGRAGACVGARESGRRRRDRRSTARASSRRRSPRAARCRTGWPRSSSTRRRTLPLDAALSMSTVAQQEIFDSDDLHEGVAAFFAKRAPAIQGTMSERHGKDHGRRSGAD